MKSCPNCGPVTFQADSDGEWFCSECGQYEDNCADLTEDEHLEWLEAYLG